MRTEFESLSDAFREMFAESVRLGGKPVHMRIDGKLHTACAPVPMSPEHEKRYWDEIFREIEETQEDEENEE